MITSTTPPPKTMEKKQPKLRGLASKSASLPTIVEEIDFVDLLKPNQNHGKYARKQAAKYGKPEPRERKSGVKYVPKDILALEEAKDIQTSYEGPIDAGLLTDLTVAFADCATNCCGHLYFAIFIG